MRCVLKDLIAISKDGEWGKGEPFDDCVEMLAIRGTDFEHVRLGDTASTPRRYVARRIAERKTLQPWDVIIEAAGGTKDQITGRTVLLRPRLFSRSDMPFTCASFSRFIRFRTDLCDPQFMFWYLQNLYFSGLMHAYHTQHTGVARFQWTTFSEREPIEVPSLPVQRQIAAILSAYDDLIENNTRRIKILERMAQALYREWFVHFRFPGHAKVKRVASPLGPIPQGWQPGTLGDVAHEFRHSVSPDEVDEDTPYIGLEHMPRMSIALGEWGCARDVQSTKLRFKKGDILFGKIRPYFHKVGVAVVDGVCSTDAIVIAPKKPEQFALVLACVSSEAFVSHATQTSQGTKMPRANWEVLTKYPLPVPPAPLLFEFSAVVVDTVALIRSLIFKNRNLRRTRDLLLPKLISGALDVSKLDLETA